MIVWEGAWWFVEAVCMGGLICMLVFMVVAEVGFDKSAGEARWEGLQACMAAACICIAASTYRTFDK